LSISVFLLCDENNELTGRKSSEQLVISLYCIVLLLLPTLTFVEKNTTPDETSVSAPLKTQNRMLLNVASLINRIVDVPEVFELL